MNKLDAKHIVVLLLAASVFLAWCAFIWTNPIICNEIIVTAGRLRNLGESEKVKRLQEEIKFLKGN